LLRRRQFEVSARQLGAQVPAAVDAAPPGEQGLAQLVRHTLESFAADPTVRHAAVATPAKIVGEAYGRKCSRSC
jgi:hypothetical protein